MTDAGSEPLSSRVIAAVAEAKGVRPSALEFRLQDEVDADALDALGAHEGGSWAVGFEVDGHDVVVDDEGAVVVDDEVERP